MALAMSCIPAWCTGPPSIGLCWRFSSCWCPQVGGATQPARLPAQKLQASAAWTLCIVFAHFPLVRAPSPASSPNLVASWVSRRLPLMWPENRACFGGYRGLGPSIASQQDFVGPLPAIRAVGRCEATDAIPTGTRRRRPIPFLSCFRATMRRECTCVWAAMQVDPILRIPPRKPCDLSGASLTTRTRGNTPSASKGHGPGPGPPGRMGLDPDSLTPSPRGPSRGPCDYTQRLRRGGTGPVVSHWQQPPWTPRSQAPSPTARQRPGFCPDGDAARSPTETGTGPRPPSPACRNRGPGGRQCHS